MKKSIKWLERLVDRITKTDCPNNNNFWYYGREVTLMSGTRDYVDVTIAEVDGGGWHMNEICFTFDFWTRELCFSSYNNYDERDAIIRGFRSIYGRISVDDDPWEEERKFYEPMIDNDEYDQEKIMKDYNELMSRKVA